MEWGTDQEKNGHDGTEQCLSLLYPKHNQERLFFHISWLATAPLRTPISLARISNNVFVGLVLDNHSTSCRYFRAQLGATPKQQPKSKLPHSLHDVEMSSGISLSISMTDCFVLFTNTESSNSIKINHILL